MRQVNSLAPWVVALVVAAGCVERPIEGVTGPGGGIIDDPADDSKPVSTNLVVSGIHPEADAAVTIQAATKKYAKGDSSVSFEDLVTVRSSVTPDPSVDGTNWYRWSATIQIPQSFWFLGVSGGWVAHTRAKTKFADAEVILGTPEQPYSQAVCTAYRANNNVFGATYGSLLATGCQQTASDSLLVSEFRTAKYDDSCFEEGKACCTDGSTRCRAGLTCNADGWCVGASPAPSGKPASGGVAPDAKQCTPGDTKEASAGTPSNCTDASFTVMGYVTCLSNGKWGTAVTYYDCNSISEGSAGTSKKCYCDAAGDRCGAGTAANGKGVDSAWICDDTTRKCIPGTCCRDTYSSAGVLLGMRCWGTPSKSCWLPSDLTPGSSCGTTDDKLPDPSTWGYGGFSSTGGSTTVYNRGGAASGGAAGRG